VLERHLAAGPPPGRTLLTAMGPGFGFEHVMMVAG
jgi:predicted naringenin-chalcone synthase